MEPERFLLRHILAYIFGLFIYFLILVSFPFLLLSVLDEIGELKMNANFGWKTT
jgi:hypothetical protein